MLEGPLAGTFPPPNDKFAWQASIEELVDGNLYEVTLVVSWPTARGVRTAPMVTRINDPIASRDENLQWDAF